MGGSMDDISESAWNLSVAAHLMCAAVFLLLFFVCLSRVVEPLASIQVAPLRSRLHWCAGANVYVCFMSVILNLVHITNFEGTMQGILSSPAAVIKPLEYLLTCPLIMLTLVVLAGDKVPLARQTEVAVLTATILITGFFASLMKDMIVKFMLFGVGVCIFLILMQRIQACVVEHSGGSESLYAGMHGSVYKHLCIKIVMSWCLFPIWWIFSSEGLNIVSSYEANTLITAAINIFAKGVYVVFVQNIHAKYIGSDDLMHHPTKRSHLEQDALFKAARLGPVGALDQIMMDMKRQEETMTYIRKHIAEGNPLTPRSMEYCEASRDESKEKGFTPSTAASSDSIGLPGVELQVGAEKPLPLGADWQTEQQSIGLTAPRFASDGRHGQAMPGAGKEYSPRKGQAMQCDDGEWGGDVSPRTPLGARLPTFDKEGTSNSRVPI